jgi:FixJ family two-component response regulator
VGAMARKGSSRLPPDETLVRMVAITGVRATAADLGVSPSTVKLRLAEIYAGMGVTRLAHAALLIDADPA